MLWIGSHVSFHKDTQLLGSLEEALKYGCNTFMFYTGAPQNTTRFPISTDLTLAALMKMKELGLDYQKVMVHAPYIINLANPDADKYAFSYRFLKEELDRCEELGIRNLVLHPGSHVATTLDSGIYHITQALDQLLLQESHVTILLETMAGKGNEVGKTLEEIKRMIDGISTKERIGVCLDTCHLHDAGYDLSDFDLFLKHFDEVIGLTYLKCIHINDSKNIRSSHKDRHENIGLGNIGFDTLIKIIYHPLLTEIPKILETPYVDKKYPPYKEEITMIKNKTFSDDLIKKITSSYS